METEELQRLGRAKNAVLAYFEQHLSIPKIYIDATWDGHPIDLLAINRDGVGDVYIVKLLPVDITGDALSALLVLGVGIQPLIEGLNEISAQYKYIALVNMSHETGNWLPVLPEAIIRASFAEDGVGRVGFIAIDFPPNGELLTQTILKPERFRAKVAKLADEYVQQHEADWEIRA